MVSGEKCSVAITVAWSAWCIHNIGADNFGEGQASDTDCPKMTLERTLKAHLIYLLSQCSIDISTTFLSTGSLNIKNSHNRDWVSPLGNTFHCFVTPTFRKFLKISNLNFSCCIWNLLFLVLSMLNVEKNHSLYFWGSPEATSEDMLLLRLFSYRLNTSSSNLPRKSYVRSWSFLLFSFGFSH